MGRYSLKRNHARKEKMTEEIQARLTIHGMHNLKGHELKNLRKWIKHIADELQTEKPQVFVNNPRFTLYK